MARLLPVALCCAALTACHHGGKEARERVAREREGWEQAMADSAQNASRRLDSLRSRLGELNRETAELLHRFREVANSREVEPYFLPEVAGLQYPLQSTGIVGRLTASGQPELVAALRGKTFDRIALQTGAGRWESQTVPYDGALNHRAAGLTTVAFTGAAADSLAMAVASAAPSETLTLLYLQQTAVQERVPLSGPQRQSLALTGELARLNRETARAQRQLAAESRKAALCNEKAPANP